MLSIDELRNRQGWNISKLGHATGLDRRLLAELERGTALASAEAAELLDSQGIQGLACASDLVQRKELRGLRLRPFEVSIYNQEAWHRAIKNKPELYCRISKRSLHWLIRHVRADSALECDLWVRLVLAGAKLRLANPHACGYRGIPIVDEQGNTLGERVLPCLHVKNKDLDLLIWPQVSMRPEKWTFRLDGLVLRIAPQPCWGSLEVDGAGHNHAIDKFRTAQLFRDAIRLSKADIDSRGLVENLLQRIRNL